MKGKYCTFDVDEAVEESNGFEGEEVGQVLQAHFKRVPVVQLEVGVNRQTQVLLNLLTQLVQQMLRRVKGQSGTVKGLTWIKHFTELSPRLSHLFSPR